MGEVSWAIKGREFNHCNCDYGCPCQFNGRPTHGNCRAVIGIAIEQGHHGETKLDGLNVIALAAWPGAIHEGGGEVLAIVDERADAAQRDALLRILSGQDTEPGATIFQVFAAMFDRAYPPVFAQVGVEVDVDGRTARLNVPGLVEARGQPIRNPVTGEAHRARIDLPNGFEFAVAEVGRGWITTTGPIELTMSDSHAHFANLNLTSAGVAR